MSIYQVCDHDSLAGILANHVARFKPGPHCDTSISTRSGTFDAHKHKHKKERKVSFSYACVYAHQRFRYASAYACECLRRSEDQDLYSKAPKCKHNFS